MDHSSHPPYRALQSRTSYIIEGGGNHTAELALWKAKINEKEEDFLEGVKAKKAKVDIQSERRGRHITSGASIVIKNTC